MLSSGVASHWANRQSHAQEYIPSMAAGVHHPTGPSYSVCYHNAMAKHLHNESYIDHFLQADILNKLAAAEGPIRFSDLKQDGIENSLFMYHTNKLIGRGLVDKTDTGFTLTLKGVRWVNYSGTLHDFSITTPRPLVQFIIQDGADNTLLAIRRGQLRKQLNDYLLPGNVYQYGLTLEENASAILRQILVRYRYLPLPY
jgi:hypothetical protein